MHMDHCASKRSKINSTTKTNNNNSSSDHGTQNETLRLLLPGLPNHLAERCLSSLPPPLLFSVCHSWRRFLYSPSFPPFFSLYALLFNNNKPSHSNYSANSSVEFFCFDPISSTWTPLPGPPQNPPLRLLYRHPSFLSRKLPVQSLVVYNNLILIAATTPHFLPALASPLIFSPESGTWFFGPQLSVPRRWCATGSVGGAVYVASGVGAHYRVEVARSMEKWDLKSDREDWKWDKKAQLKDGRFSREAVEAVGFRGNLCMVNLKGNGAKEGAIYNVELEKWKEMPEGMHAGWNGPAASTMNEEELYVVNEGKGCLSKYDAEYDRWDEMIELAELKGAEQIAAAGGRICAVCENGERIVVVDVLASPARAWIVDPPRGFQVVAVHVLPRMYKQD